MRVLTWPTRAAAVVQDEAEVTWAAEEPEGGGSTKASKPVGNRLVRLEASAAGEHPLHAAMRANSYDCVLLLVDHISLAQLSQSKYKGQTCLESAAGLGAGKEPGALVLKLLEKVQVELQAEDAAMRCEPVAGADLRVVGSAGQRWVTGAQQRLALAKLRDTITGLAPSILYRLLRATQPTRWQVVWRVGRENTAGDKQRSRLVTRTISKDYTPDADYADYSGFHSSQFVEDLVDAKVEKYIAHGVSASLYKAKWNDMDCAIKKFKIHPNSDPDLAQGFRNEVFLLKKLAHENLIVCYAVCDKPPALFALILELMVRTLLIGTS
jgi:hypothetical protein